MKNRNERIAATKCSEYHNFVHSFLSFLFFCNQCFPFRINMMVRQVALFRGRDNIFSFLWQAQELPQRVGCRTIPSMRSEFFFRDNLFRFYINLLPYLFDFKCQNIRKHCDRIQLIQYSFHHALITVVVHGLIHMAKRPAQRHLDNCCVFSVLDKLWNLSWFVAWHQLKIVCDAKICVVYALIGSLNRFPCPCMKHNPWNKQ